MRSESVDLKKFGQEINKDSEINKLITNLKESLSLKNNEQIDSLFILTDRNKDDKISRDEFIKLINTVNNNWDLVDILQIFDFFDKNKDGFISHIEFQRSLGLKNDTSKIYNESEEYDRIYNNIHRLFIDN